MKVVHETVVRPQAGSEQATVTLLEELGAVLAREPGFIEGYTLDGLEEGSLLARISIWESREAAERSTTQDQTIALRARIQGLSHPSSRELSDFVSERADVGV